MSRFFPPIRKLVRDIIGEPNTDNGPLKVHFWALGPYCLSRIHLAFRRNRLRGGSGGYRSLGGYLRIFGGKRDDTMKLEVLNGSHQYGRLLKTIDGALCICLDTVLYLVQLLVSVVLVIVSFFRRISDYPTETALYL